MLRQGPENLMLNFVSKFKTKRFKNTVVVAVQNSLGGFCRITNPDGNSLVVLSNNPNILFVVTQN